jgi:molecular chaperone DnaK
MNIILGIDFGTTNTIICYFENNKSNILYDGIYKTIKSKVGFKDEKYSCGNYISLNNDKLFYNFKTKIGLENIDNILLIFFNHLKKIVDKKFPNYILKTVITVPSNFNDIQREIIKYNFINAGFDVIRILNEPSAAALSYGIMNNTGEKILVLDLGGGTLDLNVLINDDGLFEILHNDGLNDLGGNNFTDIIYQYILKEYPDFDKDKLEQLWFICQNAKEKLSWIDNYEIKINLYNKKTDLIINITSKHFEKLCYLLIDKIKNLLLNIHKIYSDIKYILLVGISSKIPFIKKIILNIFKITPWIHPNLDSVVAEGACLYGAILENKYKTDESILLLDVLPLSLGVETADGNMSIIIPKNTPIPVKKTERYTIDKIEQKSVKINVYQGERTIANKNKLIGEIMFDNISIGGIPQIDITFKVDFNSIITIIITDRKSGVEKNVIIKDLPKFNLSEIDNIINMANYNNNIDQEEMIYNNRLYLLNTKIDIAMNNIKMNYLLDDNKKNELLDELYNIDKEKNTNDNVILLNLINKIDDKFSNLININIEDEETEIITPLEKIRINELKEELYNKTILLLNKNPEWNEYLQPIIDNINLSNINLEYLQNKLDLIIELENNDDSISYKEQFKNLCLFIKNQIEEKLIQLDDNKMNELIILVEKSLILIENDNNINWELELNNFNDKCSIINFS